MIKDFFETNMQDILNYRYLDGTLFLFLSIVHEYQS